MGELSAWIIGGDLMLDYLVASIAVALGWSGYFVNIMHAVGITIPVWCSNAPGTVPGALINLPAMLVVLFLTAILIFGIKESARFTSIMVFVKLITVVIFIAVGCFNIKPVNWVPFLPFGFKGVMTAAAIIFFAYIGFDAISTAAEETKNPQRNMPIGIILSLTICTVIYPGSCNFNRDGFIQGAQSPGTSCTCP
jgi:APA family basic amino acid/polyamine antiporter